ncbi:MAG: universal stress protein [Bacillota bacterium]|nr:universal stress protein [Bacillota bacterium]
MYKILLAVDGSGHSHKTIEEVVKLAAGLKAEITVLTVAEVPNVTSCISQTTPFSKILAFFTINLIPCSRLRKRIS